MSGKIRNTMKAGKTLKRVIATLSKMNTLRKEVKKEEFEVSHNGVTVVLTGEPQIIKVESNGADIGQIVESINVAIDNVNSVFKERIKEATKDTPLAEVE